MFNTITKKIILFCLIIFTVVFQHVFLYTTIQLESSVVRLLDTLREVGFYRLLNITTISSIKHAFSPDYILVWLIIIAFFVLQFVMRRLRIVISSGISLVLYVIFFLFLFPSSYIYIIVHIHDILMILTIITLLIEVIIEIKMSRKKNQHFLNLRLSSWADTKIFPIVYFILATVLLRYQANTFYTSLNNVFVFIMQSIFIIAYIYGIEKIRFLKRLTHSGVTRIWYATCVRPLLYCAPIFYITFVLPRVNILFVLFNMLFYLAMYTSVWYYLLFKKSSRTFHNFVQFVSVVMTLQWALMAGLGGIIPYIYFFIIIIAIGLHKISR